MSHTTRTRKSFAGVAFTTTPTGGVPKRALFKILRSGHVALYQDMGSFLRLPAPAMLAFYVANGVRSWIDEEDVKRIYVSWEQRVLWMLREQAEEDDGLDQQHREVLFADKLVEQDRLERTHVRSIQDLELLEYIERCDLPFLWRLTPAGVAKRQAICSRMLRARVAGNVAAQRRSMLTVIDGGRS